MARLPRLLKQDPTAFFDTIYPSRGPKPQAGCSVAAWEAHCRNVFELPATPPSEIMPVPDPDHLPFTASSIRAALGGCYKGNKSSGPSPVPTQLVKHLHGKNDETLAAFFAHVATTQLPTAWNTVRVTPVHKKGDKSHACNYRPVSVLGPVAKLFATCLSMLLEQETTHRDWHAPTQAGFRRRHRLEDLAVPVDYAISRA